MKNRYGTLIIAALFLCIGIFSLWFFSPDIAGSGTYLSTKHGDGATGVNRASIGGTATGAPNPYPDAGGAYPIGFCGHCHEQHASVGGTEPIQPAMEGAAGYALFKKNSGADKNTLCYFCHDKPNFGLGAGYGRYGVYMGSTNYGNSTHNTSGSMKWPHIPPPGPTFLDAGNCDNCHNPHGYNDGSGVIGSMLFSREQNLCFACHDGSVALKNVQTVIITGTASHHDVTAYSGKHVVGTQETSAYISTAGNKHVECEDCHNPHMVKGTLHTASANYQTANGNLASNSGMLTGVMGAVATFPTTTNWPASTSITYSLNVITKEYEVCFRCHAYYNTSVATWGGAGAAAWTDVGLEFNPGNQSYHPVAQALPATDPSTTYGSVRLAANQLVNGWAPGDTMYCTDCHDTDSTAAKGPHGSSVKWMLAGPNRAWPYLTALENGTSGTTYRTLGGGTANYTKGLGTSDGLFCLNCHPSTFTQNNVHNFAEHQQNNNNYSCVTCHIRVPHGGKVSRLISTKTAGLPARYAPNGNGGGWGAGYFTRFKRATSPTSYADGSANCGATTCTSSHSNTTGEYW